MESSSNIGISVVERVFSGDKKIPEAVTLSSRGSLDRRSKDSSPEPAKGKESTLMLKKAPRGVRIEGASMAQSPKEFMRIDLSKERVVEKKNAPAKAPLRILRSRKIGGASSALAMRHPSPKTVTSFVTNSNISNSNLGEDQLTRVEPVKSSGIIQHKRVQLKRVTECQAVPSTHNYTHNNISNNSSPKHISIAPTKNIGKKVQANNNLKVLLNTTHQQKQAPPRSSSQASDITEMKHEKNLERVQSAARIPSPSQKLFSAPKTATKVATTASSPKAAQSQCQTSTKTTFSSSPSKCNFN